MGKLSKEDVSDHDLLNFYLDWVDGMRWGFNGTPHPPEFPRCNKELAGMSVGIGFTRFELYCKERGVI
jgi:hypothetical protein